MSYYANESLYSNWGLLFCKLCWFCISALFCPHFKECSLQFEIFFFFSVLSVYCVPLFVFESKKPSSRSVAIGKILLLILPGGFPIKYKSKNQPLARCCCYFFVFVYISSIYLLFLPQTPYPSAQMFVYYFDVSSFICI